MNADDKLHSKEEKKQGMMLVQEILSEIEKFSKFNWFGIGKILGSNNDELRQLSLNPDEDFLKIVTILTRWVLSGDDVSLNKFKTALQESGHIELSDILEAEYSSK